ncbi:MAG: hypothetical protein RR365_14100 [Bacteroides sp.]
MPYHIKLIKALSYSGAVEATAAHPDVFLEDEATAQAAVASGYFTFAENPGTTAPPETPTGEITLIDTMNVTQLRAYIKKNAIEVDLPSGTSANELREAIAAANAAAEDDAAAAQFMAGEDPGTTAPPETPTGTEGN